MFLTRFEVNTARRGARTLLRSPQALHGSVLAAFPAMTEAANAHSRLLWRVDFNPRQVLLYIVSHGPPDLTHLVESAGWPMTNGWETRDYRPFLNALRVGDRWGFRLAANPSRHGRKTADAPATQRFGHLTAEQQRAWLLARAERHGFVVPLGEQGEADVAVRRRAVQRFPRQGQTVTLSTAVLDGILEISNSDTIVTALTRGIGPGKAYGCGLLTLARQNG